MAWSIVEVTSENSDLLNNVAEDVFDYEISSEHLGRYLDQAGHKLFVAIAAGVVVGQIRGMIHYQPDEPPHLYIDNLGVAPTHKRQGIARALFVALTSWAKSKGCSSFWVATECDNDEGNGFYRGIKLSGEKMYFYEGVID
ncbi:GNAT family N-acetyltransferase [Maritalea porphyrae]|uniref:N-acetyltransferase domain-containing protein n=1 Tax=Maritalea porphyrae TaxID=880732 RepID=A0ABQ5US37_9HYPH|nr:GNAT family N-acetyltransferase [Maritalea porphyrae]GLQ17135.1 hypothetical protein GCM10007879_13840 [Maritalea porphyrae]